MVSFQELKGDTWVFDSNAMIFCNKQLIGCPTDFVAWAEENHNYEIFRPMALYQTLAEQQYKEYMNKDEVCTTIKTGISGILII